MSGEDDVRRAERELENLLDGQSPLEKALVVIGVLRKVYGGEWVIDAKADGGFSLTKVLPKDQKTL